MPEFTSTQSSLRDGDVILPVNPALKSRAKFSRRSATVRMRRQEIEETFSDASAISATASCDAGRICTCKGFRPSAYDVVPFSIRREAWVRTRPRVQTWRKTRSAGTIVSQRAHARARAYPGAEDAKDCDDQIDETRALSFELRPHK